MRLTPRSALLPAALALLVALPSQASAAHVAKTVPHARVGDDRPSGAECRTRIDGSHATAYCHNPFPEVDRVALHVECDRWWDIDSDGSPVLVGPAETVRLTGRCWKEIRAVWVSHRP
ncbi:hypothetical protein ACFY93_27765 [Streptomyces sp. NPDC008313]|uniref:hypothetical protein n=1 Tax=Streptomyces sp. NPDC008313 TaxID=3364826 RepID=UPI0036E79E0E